ncbi:DUF6153 family protein [Streptomyces sp. NBC_01260]|uniref:DUF6153 family protein n=1 Tax=unclassified Streptomyces TaxID=2593676 RepID=UPI000F48A60E|nr:MULTISPECIES: DUF6153 family protein [unclassified Streptomyces]ROQ71055.1 hypothetical protein EDD95_7146 [Streptomyces sp. CEV 2-1]RPK52157.1 hypothetical protein EES39_02465 [Streptomyces sp. ADI92-24]
MFGMRGARYGQLLLFAALLFGIVTMHTVGHPAEHSGQGAAAMTASHATAAGTVHPDARRPARPAPMRGMDPMAVCLAVLSVWGLALLTVLMVARRPADSVAGGAGTRTSWRPRPPPPPRPRKAVLTDLSVLRI